jgi:hypothetical protein
VTTEDRQEWKRDAAALGILAAVILTGFADLLIGDSTVLSARYFDVHLLFAHWRELTASELAAGNLPLWNPYIFGGVPLLGGFQAAVLYPPNLIYLLLPTTTAINWEFILHLMVAGSLTYGWLGGHALQRPARLFGALLFVFSGPVYTRIAGGHLPHLDTIAWAPGILLVLDRLRTRPTAGWVTAGAVIVALQLLAGFPEIAFLTALFAGIYCVLTGWAASADIPERRRRVQRLGRSLGLFAVVYLIGAGLAAIQILPGLEAAAESTRSTSVDYATASSYSIGWDSLATLVVPFVFGGSDGVTYWGRWYFHTNCLFFGVAGLLLATYGLTCKRFKLRPAVIVIVVGALAVALGSATPVHRLLYDWLPIFGRFRGPADAMFVAHLLLALAAAAGLQRVCGAAAGSMNTDAGRQWRLSGTGIVALAAAAVLAAAALFVSPAAWRSVITSFSESGLVTLRPEGFARPEFVAQAIALTRSSLTQAALAATLLGLLFSLNPARRWLPAALVIVAGFELAHFSWQARRQFAEDELPLPAPMTAQLQQVIGDARVLFIDSVLSNRSMANGWHGLWGYGPDVARRYAELVDATQGNRAARVDEYLEVRRIHPLFTLLRLRYVIGAPRHVIPGATEVYADEQYKVFELSGALPRAFVPATWEVVPDSETALNRLTSPDFDPSATAIVTAGDRPASLPEPPPGAVTAGIDMSAEADYNRPTIRCTAAGPTLIVVTDSYRRGWRAVDPDTGKTYDVLPVNHALIGVLVGAGTHTFELRYEPESLATGAKVSAATAAALIVLLIVQRCRRRRRRVAGEGSAA